MARREITTAFEIENGLVLAGTVKVIVTISEGRGADKVEYAKDMVHYLDYAGCTLDEIVDSAAANDVVSLQNGVWRGLGSGVKSEENETTSMKAWYNRETTRSAPDPVKAVLKADMDADKLAALIEALEAKLAEKG